MNTITAFLIPPAAIRVAFRYDAATVAKIKTIKGAAFVKEGKFWTVPIRQLDALIETLGDALAVHPDVLAAKSADEERRIRTFVANCHHAGISLAQAGERVVGSGGAYTPLWQAEIDARASEIIRLGLATKRYVSEPDFVNIIPPAPDATPETMRQAGLMLDGMANAAANQYAQEHRRKGWWE